MQREAAIRSFHETIAALGMASSLFGAKDFMEEVMRREPLSIKIGASPY